MANAEVDALDFEDDDLMDEDGTADVDASSSPRAPQPKLKSAITGGAPKKTKGRGFREEADSERHSRLADRNFESLGTDGGPGPQRCESRNPYGFFFLIDLLSCIVDLAF